MEPLDQHITEALADGPVESAPAAPARVLVVADDRPRIRALAERLNVRHHCRCVARLAEAQRLLEAGRYDVVLIDPQRPDGDGLDLARRLQEASHAVKTIVVSGSDSVHAAIEAIRCGASDFIRAGAPIEEYISRIESALAQCRVEQHRENRLMRLKQVCKQLNIARHEISEQVDLLCHDLVCAYQEMSEQLSEVATASEFRTLLRQELDVEELLRTMLEYILAKTGPTNAAVFLPETPSSFALGAYVNYDCPRESIAPVLERLSEAICPQMAGETEIVRFDHPDDFRAFIGMECPMFAESDVIAFSCRHDGQCMAIILLFRNHSESFEASLASLIELLRPILAEQLSSIVRIHHRARDQWPDEPSGDAIDEDGETDDEPGFGGLAA